MTEHYIQQAKSVIDCEIEGLQAIKTQLGDGFTSTVQAAIQCLQHGSKLIVTGIGKNLHIAEKIAATLASTGSTGVVLHPSQAVHGDLGILQAGDLMLALSYSGESEELINLLPAAKRLGVKMVAVTGVPESTLAQYADIVAPVAVPCEACPFNMAPTTSTTATLAWGDALAMVLLEARGFKREDYAMRHPGGAIGRALLLRVADIMRTNERMAIAKQQDTIKTVMLTMTQARCGSAAITQDDGSLAGVFTDGDLRRHLEKEPDLLNQPVAGYMSDNPVTVHPDDLAVDVLNRFETHQIDDILVVNDQHQPVGTVDIQDLPRFKVL